MTPKLSHADLEELLGAYALDAVDDKEAEAIELHLRDCPRCRSTVGEFRETASLLAIGHEPAPVELWDGIVASLEDSGPGGLDMSRVVPLRPRRERRLRIALAAAAAVIIAVLGFGVVAQDRRLDDMQSALGTRTILAAALAAQGHPEARRAEMRTADGKLLAHAVLVPDGTGFVWSGGLPALEGGRTYQLWGAIGAELISLGVLGTDPSVIPFRVSGEVAGLAITDEAAGGVVASQNKPVVTGLVVSA